MATPASNGFLDDPLILVADADDYRRAQIIQAVSPDSYRIAQTQSEVETLAKFDLEFPDMVILGLDLPTCNALQTCALIRKLPGGDHIPILFIAPCEEEEIFEKVMQAGGTDIVVAPIHKAVLRQRALRLLSARQAEKSFRFLAHHDSLTGLPNRALFSDRLGIALSKAEREEKQIAVLFIDLDRFKIVNDSLGHDAGDQLLKTASLRLTRCIREYDTVARLGGDEFIILIDSIRSTTDAAIIAERVVQALREPFMCNEVEVVVTTSVGIAMFPTDGVDITNLIKNADAAMYRAKETGKNRYEFFEAKLSKDVSKRLKLESMLRHAVPRNELVLHYQPIIDELETGQVMGAEALVRWNHPEQGLIPPLDFIPLAEETRLIIPIGEWVLREACRQNKAWENAGLPPLVISVNVSIHQILQADFFEIVTRALTDNNLPGERLNIEITESAVMFNPETIIPVLKKLRFMGVHLSIDDFGTGYSSLSYLKRFPVDTLKIDRSFVRDIPGDANNAALTAAIIAMAHILRMRVVAEGVETLEQRAFLRAQACDALQGYYFSKPIPSDQFQALLLQKGMSLSA